MTGCSTSTNTSRAARCGSSASCSLVHDGAAGTPRACRSERTPRRACRSRVHAPIGVDLVLAACPVGRRRVRAGQLGLAREHSHSARHSCVGVRRWRSSRRRRPPGTRRAAHRCGGPFPSRVRHGAPSTSGQDRVGRVAADHLARCEVDELALARASRCSSAARIADGQRVAAAVVGRLADLGRRAVGVAGLVAQAAGRPEDAGQAGAEGLRPGRAVGRRRRHDEVRMIGEQRFGPSPRRSMTPGRKLSTTTSPWRPGTGRARGPGWVRSTWKLSLPRLSSLKFGERSVPP